MQPGTRANLTGKRFEKVIEHTLIEKGYKFVDRKHFKSACCLEQPIYSSQVVMGKSIYDTDYKSDFAIYHPVKHPNCLDIQAKWQQGPGTVDEKFPYIIMTIKEKLPIPSVIILDGKGYREKAEEWLRKQVDNKKLLHVFNLMEFQIWANSEEL
jgi:hypothetical protein